MENTRIKKTVIDVFKLVCSIALIAFGIVSFINTSLSLGIVLAILSTMSAIKNVKDIVEDIKIDKEFLERDIEDSLKFDAKENSKTKELEKEDSFNTVASKTKEQTKIDKLKEVFISKNESEKQSEDLHIEEDENTL